MSNTRPKTTLRPLTYLACPYTFSGVSAEQESEIKERRFRQCTWAAAVLMDTKGWNVFSPITHSHPMHVLAGMRGDWKFWERIDTEFLQLSRRLVVLCIPGWAGSTGVSAEIKIAQKLGIEILYMSLPVKEEFPLGEGQQATYHISPFYYEV